MRHGGTLVPLVAQLRVVEVAKYDDASALAIAPGNEVEVESRRGRLRAETQWRATSGM